VITWERVTRRRLCGGCGAELLEGTPVQAIEVPDARGGTTKKIRCEQCAGPAPPALPRVVVVTSPLELPRWLRLKAAAAPAPPVDRILRDWKHDAAGEREPGQEG
jgi:hypothetical protein